MDKISDSITVDFDRDRSRFIIDAPPWYVAWCRALPNRRWDGKRKRWTAPAIRANADYLRRSVTTETKIRLTQLAADRVEVILSAQRERHQHGNFPTTYAFRTKPKQYQLNGINALYGLPAMAWFMDMGCGKTKCVIDVHAALFVDHRCSMVVVLCPLTIRDVWVRELAKHMPQFVPFTTHLLATDKSGQRAYARWMANDFDGQRWLIIGVESLAGSKTALDIALRALLSTTRAATIVDESSKIKNDSATRTKAAYRMARVSEWRTIMTGTPIANGPLDLYAQFEFLDPNIIGLGDFWSFRNRYAVMGGYEFKEVIGYQNLDELMEIIAPFVYQVRKADVLDLPPKTYQIREVSLNDEQRRMYLALLIKKVIVTGNRQMMVKNALEKMLRLQEIIGGFVSYENDAVPIPGIKQPKTTRHAIPGVNPKIAELMDIVAESGQSTIIWCVFRSEIDAVVAALRAAKHDVVQIHGDVAEGDRALALATFQEHKARFLVANAQTGGLGLTMTAGTLEIYFSNTFNYIDREQSEDRAHRIGQTQAVTIIDLIAKGTVDEHIYRALQAKENVSEYVRRHMSPAGELPDP